MLDRSLWPKVARAAACGGGSQERAGRHRQIGLTAALSRAFVSRFFRRPGARPRREPPASQDRNRRGRQPSFCARAIGIGDKRGRIARPARADSTGTSRLVISRTARDQFAHRPAAAGAEVERATVGAVEQRPQRPHMGIGKIAHVDVIAHAGAIGGRVVVAENRKAVAPPAAASSKSGMAWVSGT